MTNMVNVDTTTLIYVWNGLLRYSGSCEEKVIHKITTTPTVTAIIAETLSAFLTINPSKNNPNIAPPNTPVNCHQVASML